MIIKVTKYYFFIALLLLLNACNKATNKCDSNESKEKILSKVESYYQRLGGSSLTDTLKVSFNSIQYRETDSNLNVNTFLCSANVYVSYFYGGRITEQKIPIKYTVDKRNDGKQTTNIIGFN